MSAMPNFKTVTRAVEATEETTEDLAMTRSRLIRRIITTIKEISMANTENIITIRVWMQRLNDWNLPPEPKKPRGRNRKQENRQADADGWKTRAEDMTNIYIVKPPVPPKAFISGRRVSAPALVPEAEDEVPLARGYGLDDAGSSVTSSCAKYAL